MGGSGYEMAYQQVQNVYGQQLGNFAQGLQQNQLQGVQQQQALPRWLSDYFLHTQGGAFPLEEVSERRGEKLLREHLTPAQLADWEARDFFIVAPKPPRPRRWWQRQYRGDLRQHRYRLYRNGTVGVELSRGMLQSFCIRPDNRFHYFPTCDRLLMLKLMLETDEKHFRETARIMGTTPIPMAER